MCGFFKEKEPCSGRLTAAGCSQCLAEPPFRSQSHLPFPALPPALGTLQRELTVNTWGGGCRTSHPAASHCRRLNPTVADLAS